MCQLDFYLLWYLVEIRNTQKEQVRPLISAYQKILCLFCSCCVEHKCHRYSLDLIPSTCVVKPDYHREDDGLGISHSVTHRCFFRNGACAQSRESKKEREIETERGDGT